MSTSGVNTFNLTRNQIIEMALSKIGVKTFGRSPTAAEIEQAATFLNAMIKHWKTAGINLWKTTVGTLFLTVGQASYILDGSTANATEAYTYSKLSADSVAGDNTITVEDITQFTEGYYIGIMQDDNTSLWTTITNITGSIITLATTLTADASTGNYVYSYQTKINRPELIGDMQLFLNSDQNVPSIIYSQNSYANLPTRTSTQGIPNLVYYDKQLTYGSINLWPIPNVNTYYTQFTFQKQFDDFVTSTNTPDFPQEWLRPLYLNLAVELLEVYGKKAEDYQKLIIDAKESLDNCNGYDREDTSIYFQPASDQNIYTYR